MTSPRTPPSYREQHAAAMAASSAAARRGRARAPAATASSAEGISFLSALPPAGHDEVETPATITLTILEQVVGWILRQKHPLLIVLHLVIAVVTVITVAMLAAAPCSTPELCEQGIPTLPPNLCKTNDLANWTGEEGFNNSSSGSNTTNSSAVVFVQGGFSCRPCVGDDKEDDDSQALWKLTRKELLRTVRKAVRSAFLKPDQDEASVFHLFIQAVTAHLAAEQSSETSRHG